MIGWVTKRAVFEHLHKRILQTANNNCGYVADAGVIISDLADRLQGWLNEMDIVDAVPVVHGAWRSTEGLYTNGICYCSVCETEYYFSDLYDVGEEAQSRLPYFCPHCGAMMNWEEVATDNAKMDGEA